MQQFYTLDEAARVLGVSPDEVKKMADRNEVRAFRDRGTMRFRAPEIDELARRRGRGSDPDLQLGETTTAPPAPAPRTPKPASKSPSPKPRKTGAGSPEVFEFSLDDSSDQVEIGQEMNLSGSSKSKGSKGGPGSSSKLRGKSPAPKPGSDSDVRLVADGSDLDFKVASDSDVKLVDGPNPVPAATPPTKRKTGAPSSGKLLDSGVQMVPMDVPGDSDVRLSGTDSAVAPGQKRPKTGSDSDIRLESPKPRPGRSPDSSAEMLTEEIDLDAELRQAEEAEKARKQTRRKSQVKPPAPSAASPFELSEADLQAAPAEQAAGPASVDESSSDFDLTPAGADSSPQEPSSGEIALEPAAPSDDEITLGELTGGGSKSGINLRDPADSGISLEQGQSSEEIEFELGPDQSGTKTPPPAAKSEADSDSEFELSMDEEPGAAPAGSEADSDSEFELSLEPDASPVESSSHEDSSSPVDSDSEFELTLDDSGGLALEGSSETEAPAAGEGEEKDIFETDFEVPSLDEESGSQAVALEDSDTDLESSDFDLALGDEDIASEEESGSQVVVLEDEGEAADDSAETVARPRSARGAPVLAEGEEEVEDLFDMGAAGEEEEEETAGARPAAAGAMVPAPAEWGILPTALMIPCVVVMFLVALMGYELVRQDGLNRPSNPLTRAITSMFTDLKD